jgi:uncharacterized protein YdcH (DUF465 family)
LKGRPIVRGEPRGSGDGLRHSGKTKGLKHGLLTDAVTPTMKGRTLMNKALEESLTSKHAALHARIDQEETRSHPDESLLHQLKKEKLRLKDELAGHHPH